MVPTELRRGGFARVWLDAAFFYAYAKKDLEKALHYWNMFKPAAMISKAQIFAFTSQSEGFPNVLIEALSFALPCVAFDCVAGPSDIIEDNQNGFLIPLLDTEMFQKKLALLMSDQELHNTMSESALASSEKYDVKVISAQFLKFITS